MNMKTKQNTCFWKEITDYNILIPSYQRDYAQGRNDRRIDNIRQVFVSELYGALTEDKKCHLGLVFGSYDETGKTFVAVDGQQRLTTVFLLHWYVAWKENNLSKYSNILKKFKWNTRSYSVQFVHLLFSLKSSKKAIIQAITENCNYFSIWENDPTVKNMKTMLEEIESQYPDTEICSKLFSENCNITYDILTLKKDSDARTYLKMNSRGRSLTTFENFKSNFINNYEKFFDSNKLDNAWLNFMLKMSKPDNVEFRDPDIYFMNYINEYTYLLSKLEGQKDSKAFIEAKLKDGEIDVPFIRFDEYKAVFNENSIKLFEKSFDWIIDNYSSIKEIDDEARFSDSKFFVDTIIKENNPEYSHRVMLFSLLKYAELSNYVKLERKTFARWTRIFRNLIENSEIYEDEMTNVCKAINGITDINIYSYLSTDITLKGFDSEQTIEETEKVKKIVEDSSWEAKIIEAEKYAFFKGAIRFLFQDSNGQVTEESWKAFDTKWENAKKYFKESPEPNQSAMKHTFDNATLLKALISRFVPENFWDVLNWYHRVFNNYTTTWRYYLLSNNIYGPVHAILMGEDDIQEIEPSQDDEAQNRLYQLSNTNLLDYVIERIPYSWIRYYHNHIAIFPSAEGIFLNADTRDTLLHKLFNNKVIEISKDCIVPNTHFLFGTNINFKYSFKKQTYFFQWWGTPDETQLDIYLMENEWVDYKKRPKPTHNKKTEEDTHYCFRVSSAMETNTSLFTKQLDKLIEEAKKE